MQLCEKASRFTSNRAVFERCENAKATNKKKLLTQIIVSCCFCSWDWSIKVLRHYFITKRLFLITTLPVTITSSLLSVRRLRFAICWIWPQFGSWIKIIFLLCFLVSRMFFFHTYVIEGCGEQQCQLTILSWNFTQATAKHFPWTQIHHTNFSYPCFLCVWLARAKRSVLREKQCKANTKSIKLIRSKRQKKF